MAYRNNGLGISPMQYGIPAFTPDAMQQASQTYQAWLKSIMTVNEETTRFLTHRMREDIQLPMRIVQCHSPQEVMQQQIEFWNTMAKDYMQQTQKLQAIYVDSFQSIDRPTTLDWSTPRPGAGSDRSDLKAA